MLLAIVAGILLGHYAPATAIRMEVLSKSFVQVIKWFIPPLIFFTITLGISGMSDLKRVGTVGIKALLYFEIVTTFALLAGIAVAWVIQPGSGVTPPGAAPQVQQYADQAASFSWSHFLLQNTTLQVLALSLVSGTVLGQYSGKARVVAHLNHLLTYLFRALHLVMLFAPLAAFGGMAFTIGKYGWHTLIPLGRLMITVYATMAVFIFGVLGMLMRYCKVSLWGVLNYIKEELLLVFGASSSEAALPALMEKLVKMGCSRPVTGLVVPTGYSFNLDGTTIYLSMAIIFLAQAYQADLSLAQGLAIVGVLMVTSKGAAGVTGSGFVVLASTLTAVKVIPLEGLALLIGVDRFMSEARAITNFIGNAVATIFISHHEGDFDREMMATALSTEVYEYESLD